MRAVEPVPDMILVTLCKLVVYRGSRARRGKGAGYTDEASEPAQIGMETIKVIRPNVFIMECATTLARDAFVVRLRLQSSQCLMSRGRSHEHSINCDI